MVRVVPMCIGPTAISNTAGTDTAMGGGNYTLPVWAKSLMAMSLAVQADLPTATQAIIARANLTSDNVPVQPFHALAAPMGGILGVSGMGAAPGPIESYDMNLRVNGGEQITPNIRALTTVTTVYGIMAVVVSDASPSEAQRHIQAGTLTTDTVISAENPGTAYAITSARNIVQLLGVDADATPATSEGHLARIRFSSTEFAGLNNADLLLHPVQNGLGTLQAASVVGGVSRQNCNIPIQPVSQCNIQDYYYLLSSANKATAVPWVSAVAYEV